MLSHAVSPSFKSFSRPPVLAAYCFRARAHTRACKGRKVSST